MKSKTTTWRRLAGRQLPKGAGKWIRQLKGCERCGLGCPDLLREIDGGWMLCGPCAERFAHRAGKRPLEE